MTEKSQAAGGAPGGAAPPTGGIPYLALFTLVIGGFMAILDGSIVNVALPKLMAIFGVGEDDVQWVMTAYLLTCGVVVPITGYLGDRFGLKTMYIFSLASFTGGSLLCALAWSNSSLVAARVIQAVGGGMIMPVSMSMLYSIVPRDKIGTALGIWGISAMAAPSIGPTLGGYLVDHFGWQWIFTINLPIGVAACLVSLLVLDETPKKSGLKPDWLGSLLVSAGCFALLLALSEGQDKGWTSLYIVNLFIVAGFSLLLFVLWERAVPEPLLDIILFKNPVFAASLIGLTILTVGMFTGIFLLPLYAQNILGYTPMQTGLLLMPMAVTMGIMMPISGRLFDRVGALPLCLVGLVITAVTTYQLHTISYYTDTRQLQWLLVKRSVGMGLCMMPLTTAGMNTVPHFLVARASAINNLVRQIAGSLGIAFTTYVMLHRMDFHAARLSEGISAASPAVPGALSQLQGFLAQAGAGSYAGAAAQYVLGLLVRREALIAGMADAFIVSTAFIVISIPLVFFLSKGRVEAQRQAEYRRYGLNAPPLGGHGPAAPAGDSPEAG